jgi:hypothetical protein
MQAGYITLHSTYHTTIRFLGEAIRIPSSSISYTLRSRQQITGDVSRLEAVSGRTDWREAHRHHSGIREL